jgi:hypothetical protein
MAHMATAVAWYSWRHHAEEQRRLTIVAKKAMRRMCNPSLALTLGRWRTSASELRRQRKVQKCTVQEIETRLPFVSSVLLRSCRWFGT